MVEDCVTGFCLKTDGGVSYLACPFCYAHLCPSYFQFQASNSYNKLMIDVDSGEVIEFASERIEKLQAEIARELGYDIVHHRLELYVRRKGTGSDG